MARRAEAISRVNEDKRKDYAELRRQAQQKAYIDAGRLTTGTSPAERAARQEQQDLREASNQPDSPPTVSQETAASSAQQTYVMPGTGEVVNLGEAKPGPEAPLEHRQVAQEARELAAQHKQLGTRTTDGRSYADALEDYAKQHDDIAEGKLSGKYSVGGRPNVEPFAAQKGTVTSQESYDRLVDMQTRGHLRDMGYTDGQIEGLTSEKKQGIIQEKYDRYLDKSAKQGGLSEADVEGMGYEGLQAYAQDKAKAETEAYESYVDSQVDRLEGRGIAIEDLSSEERQAAAQGIHQEDVARYEAYQKALAEMEADRAAGDAAGLDTNAEARRRAIEQYRKGTGDLIDAAGVDVAAEGRREHQEARIRAQEQALRGVSGAVDIGASPEQEARIRAQEQALRGVSGAVDIGASPEQEARIRAQEQALRGVSGAVDIGASPEQEARIRQQEAAQRARAGVEDLGGDILDTATVQDVNDYSKRLLAARGRPDLQDDLRREEAAKGYTRYELDMSPEAMRNRRLKLAGLIGLTAGAAAITPAAVLYGGGGGALLGGGIGGGLAAYRGGDVSQGALYGASEGFVAGVGGYQAGGLAVSAAKRLPSGLRLLRNKPGEYLVEGTGGAVYDTGAALAPDRQGRVGITRNELLFDIAGSAAVGPALGATGGVLKKELPSIASVVTRQPYGRTMQQQSPSRFSGYPFASTKPLTQRQAEAQGYLQTVTESLKQSNPRHWVDVMKATGGKGYTIDNMNLRNALEYENVDAVAMLEARREASLATAQGKVAQVPTLTPGLALVARPTPWQTARPGPYLHGTADATPFLGGGPLSPRPELVAARRPGALGLFGAPDVAVSDVLHAPYDPAALSKIGRDPKPGFLELAPEGLVDVPKLSPQGIGRATPIAIRDLEQLGPSGPILREETAPTPGKRHRATVIPVNDEGKILLVKGTKDSTWMLPGGDIKQGESPVKAGERELTEETGLAATESSRAFALDADSTFHDVAVARVSGDGTPKALQANELQDYTWWDGQKPLPLQRSTRTILAEHLGKEPPRTGSAHVIQGREAYDWWPKRAALGELEGVLPVGGARGQIDPALSRPIIGGETPEGGGTPHLYLEEGAHPVTRSQIAKANALHLMQSLGLRPKPGVTFEGVEGIPARRPGSFAPVAGGADAPGLKRSDTSPEGRTDSAVRAEQRSQTVREAPDVDTVRTPPVDLPGHTLRTPPVTPPVEPPRTPPVTPPVEPPRTPPVTPPVEPPRTPPVTPPVEPPRTPPVTPPVEPPRTPPVTPPVEPPRTPPVTVPVEPPRTPPVTVPVEPPRTPPVTPPVEPPRTPPVTPPVEPPRTPPVTPPVEPPRTPPVTVPVEPPRTPPVTPPVEPPRTPPVTPPVEPPRTPPVTPPVEPPRTPPVTPPVEPPRTPPVTPPVEPPRTPPVTPPVEPPRTPPVTPPVEPPRTPPVTVPVEPPRTPPVTPPVEPPRTPPVTPPVEPPRTPPVTVPEDPPVTPPVVVPPPPPKEEPAEDPRRRKKLPRPDGDQGQRQEEDADTGVHPTEATFTEVHVTDPATGETQEVLLPDTVRVTKRGRRSTEGQSVEAGSALVTSAGGDVQAQAHEPTAADAAVSGELQGERVVNVVDLETGEVTETREQARPLSQREHLTAFAQAAKGKKAKAAKTKAARATLKTGDVLDGGADGVNDFGEGQPEGILERKAREEEERRVANQSQAEALAQGLQARAPGLSRQPPARTRGSGGQTTGFAHQIGKLLSGMSQKGGGGGAAGSPFKRSSSRNKPQVQKRGGGETFTLEIEYTDPASGQRKGRTPPQDPNNLFGF